MNKLLAKIFVTMSFLLLYFSNINFCCLSIN
jgi:hypothetical protein